LNQPPILPTIKSLTAVRGVSSTSMYHPTGLSLPGNGIHPLLALWKIVSDQLDSCATKYIGRDKRLLRTKKTQLSITPVPCSLHGNEHWTLLYTY
jgi:hypothetical protein